MGVDYVAWVVPKPRAFRPNPEQFAAFANALRVGNWVPKPGMPGHGSEVRQLLPINDAERFIRKPSLTTKFDDEPFTPSKIAFQSEHELVLEWYVKDMNSASVKFPFVFIPYPKSGNDYFCVRVILTQDYVYWTGNNVLEFGPEMTQCKCGQELAYETGWSSGLGLERIHSKCPKCGIQFDPSSFSCEMLDGWTRASSLLTGGLCFRFALAVDCHKNWPREEEAGRRYQIKPELLEPWRVHIGVPFDLVATFD